jgi:hypothetical protein
LFRKLKLYFEGNWEIDYIDDGACEYNQKNGGLGFGVVEGNKANGERKNKAIVKVGNITRMGGGKIRSV